MSRLILILILGCPSGLEPLNDICPGGPHCWCSWDTGHEYYPQLDEQGHIICDTGD